MNKIQLTGRLVADLERGETKGGTTVAKGRLAVDRLGQGGETGYVNFESYGAGADAALKNIGKGWLVAVDGRLQHDTWEKDGQSRHDYKVVGDVEFLAAPRGTGEGREQQADNEIAQEAATEAEAEQEADSLEPAEAEPVAAAAGANGIEL